ncbi:hypothetical protein GIB67_037903 [Kingdonia uniflora]|uniref:Uncharacterized protein n=1 Tax=Kingdonia uniflora TaxID=39325 RepID=A0A7J7LH19_9MAGN|nr:hypothetical protein GIB67_037903 [Kingdonia uniflora]
MGKGRRQSRKPDSKNIKRFKRRKMISKKGLANRVSRKRRAEFPKLENIQSTAENLLQQVMPGEGLVVVKDLMVDDDVEVNLEEISSEYGGGLLKWKKGNKKDNDGKKDVEENVKSEEEQPQVVEEEDSEPPTVVVYFNGKKDVQHANEVAKTDIVFFNQKEVVSETYQASADQTTVVSVEEHTIKVVQTDIVISHPEEDVGEASQLVLMELEVDVTLKKRHALTEDGINERAFIACRINQLHAHLDELLPGVLLESFIQRPISQNEKN